jgi:prepilin-type N-terminal cleavage/methylation domain-containing protein
MVPGDKHVGSPRRPDGKDSCRGVSLVELLVVIAIIAVVIGLLPVIDHSGSSSPDRVSRGHDAAVTGLGGANRRGEVAQHDLGDLRALTRAYAASPRVAERLVRWLDLAAQAEGRQDGTLKQRLIHRYITTLEKVSGPLVPPVRADALIDIARAL